MTGQITALPLELVAVVVAVSMVAGAVDIVRQPGWAWKQAGESQAAYLILDLLLPVIGLAAYAFRARPKVIAERATGSATSAGADTQPAAAIEATARVEPAEPVASAVPDRFAGFQEMAGNGHRGPWGTETARDEPEPFEISSTFFSTGAAARTVRHPLALARAYRPKQRTSLPGTEAEHSEPEAVHSEPEATAHSEPRAEAGQALRSEPQARSVPQAEPATRAEPVTQAEQVTQAEEVTAGVPLVPETAAVDEALAPDPTVEPDPEPAPTSLVEAERRARGARRGGGTDGPLRLEGRPDRTAPVPLLGRVALDRKRGRRRRRVTRRDERLTGQERPRPARRLSRATSTSRTVSPGRALTPRRSRSAAASNRIARAIRAGPSRRAPASAFLAG